MVTENVQRDYRSQMEFWRGNTGKSSKEIANLTSYFSHIGDKEDVSEDNPIGESTVERVCEEKPKNKTKKYNFCKVIGVFFLLEVVDEDEVSSFIKNNRIPMPSDLDTKKLFIEIKKGVKKYHDKLIEYEQMNRENLNYSKKFDSQKETVKYETQEIKRNKNQKLLISSVVILITALIFIKLSTHPYHLPCSGVISASTSVPIEQSYLLYLPNSIKPDSSILNPYIRSLGANEQGIWVGYSAGNVDGVSVISQQNDLSFAWQHCLGLPIQPAQNMNSFAFKDGVVFVATDGSGIAKLDSNGWSFITDKNGLPDTRIYHLFKDDDNVLWASTFNGVARQIGDNWQPVFQANINQLSSNRVYEYLEDLSGNRWFGSLDKGVSRLQVDNNRWASFFSDGVGLQNIRGMVEDSLGNIWFASDGGGVILYQDDNMLTFNSNSHGLISDNIYDIEKDKFGRIWIATNKGIAYTDNNGQTWQTVTTTTALDIQFGCAGCSIDDNHLWIALSEGLGHMIIPSPRG